MSVIVSLYDYTGYMVRPWAKAGYTCECFDILHTEEREERFGKGIIRYLPADLHSLDTYSRLASRYDYAQPRMIFGFPVCTDLAVSGAAHFAEKFRKDRMFQIKAAEYAKWISYLAYVLDDVPYMIENPVSRLSTLWRKPDYSFDPWQYGGYLTDDNAEHPDFPEYIKPYDAYPKKTCLWTSKHFIMPEPKEVPVKEGYSLQHKKLGGKSEKTKMIRSATPRGFAQAVFEANGK